MNIEILPDKRALGRRAAADGAEAIRSTLAEADECAIVVATRASQFEMLEALVAEPDIDWARVTAFHLDEYVGLPATHPASFRRNLQERFVSRVPLGRFVPDARKAAAVRAAVEGGISPERPAPALQRHGSCALYLDGPAASLLSPRAAS